MSERTDLQEDWPAEPSDKELLRLAEQFQDAVPALPVESLVRIRQQMLAELDRAERRQWHRRQVFGWSIAAAILLALSGYAYLRHGEAGDRPLVKTNEPALIDDRITVAIGASRSALVAEKPLVRLDDYLSLFAD